MNTKKVVIILGLLLFAIVVFVFSQKTDLGIDDSFHGTYKDIEDSKNWLSIDSDAETYSLYLNGLRSLAR